MYINERGSNMRKILITGSRGQLGRAVNACLTNCSDIKYELYNTGTNEAIDENLGKIHYLDITNNESVEKMILLNRPDVVINCAAHTAVDLCEKDRENAYRINVDGPKNIAVSCEKIGAKMVHISTDYIFDGKSLVPYTEEMIPNPINYYGKTKFESEQIVMKHSSKSYIIRTGWMFGEGNNFVKTMLRLSEENDYIKVVYDQNGTPTSAKEVARLILYLINTEQYGIYHGTCEGSTNWYDYAVDIFKLANKNVNVIPIKSEDYISAAKRPAKSVLENRRLKEQTTFIFANWYDELKEYMNSLKISENK